jgi:hypothetical protein
MNYTELVAAIKSYTENDYATADIDLFITQAEQRIYNSVQLPDLRKNVTGTMTSANKYLAVPSDWLSTFSIAVIDPVTNAYTFLLNKDVNFIRESFPDIDAPFYGKPEYYAIFDDTAMLIGPTPDANYNTEFIIITILKALSLLVLLGLGITLILFSFMVLCWKRLFT